MDDEAFLPVRTEELTNLEVPRRLIGLVNLINDLTAQAVALGIADRRGLTVARGEYHTGLFLRIGPAGAGLVINHKNWSRYGITPLWIEFDKTSFGRAPLVLGALKAWAPPQLFAEGGRALIPLTFLPDATRDRVLEDLLEQLRRLHAALQLAAPATIIATQ